MLKTLALTVMFALLATGASAQKIDKNGRCHDARGRFAKMEVCKGAGASMSAPKPTKSAAVNSPAPAATAASSAATATGYKLDAKGKCHDAKGRMAKKSLCKA